MVALDTASPSGLSDYGGLRARFQTFVGLSEQRDTIESGFDRLAISHVAEPADMLGGASGAARNNTEMKRRLANVPSLSERWARAVALGYARVLPTVSAPRQPSFRRLHFARTLAYVLGQILTTTLAIVSMTAEGARDAETLLLLVGVGLAAAAIYLLPQTIQAVRIFLRHLPVDGSIKQIGVALAEALATVGLIKTPIRQLEVRTGTWLDGSLCAALTGGTFYESSLFADCLGEILGPIDNPRYLIVRFGTVLRISRQDYHAVPLPLGVKKEYAQIFHEAWRRHVGRAELMYTRDATGRARLVRARARAFSAVFAGEVKRQDRWMPC